MKELFVDAGHWIALLLPSDSLHDTALGMREIIPPGTRLVTSELVLIELLNFVSMEGSVARLDAVKVWTRLLADASTIIVPTSAELLQQARDRYVRSYDKRWSFTDCASFVIMEERGIRDALTHDHHFEQAGFRALLRSGR